MAGGFDRPYRVHPGEQPAHAPLLLKRELVRGASAHFGKERVIDAFGIPVQGAPVRKWDRRDGGYLGGREIRDQLVLLEDLRLAPATRAVKLGDAPLLESIRLRLVIEL